MIPIIGFKDFQRKFEQLGPLRDLHVFILFDEPTEKVVEAFVDNNFNWLDRLAAATKVFGYAFVYRDFTRGSVANPSLQVAEMFDIRPKQLPGVVIFSMLPSGDEVADGLYMPFEPEVMSEKKEELVGFFKDVFSSLQDALDSKQDGETHVTAVRRCLEADKRQQSREGFWRFIKGQVKELSTLPASLAQAVAIAFGKEAARRAAGG